MLSQWTLKGICCVIGGFLIHLTLGSFYTFGNMSPYIASYLKLKTGSTWVTSGHTVWIFSVPILCKGLFMVAGGILEKLIGARLIVFIGCSVMSIGVFLTYIMIRINFFAVLFTYGFVMGVGMALVYPVALTAGVKWFPEKPGLVFGIVVSGFGLGSFVFTLIQTQVVNPLNISPVSLNISGYTTEKYFVDDRVLNNLPKCFLIMGAIYAVVQVIGIIMLLKPDLSITAAGASAELLKDDTNDNEKSKLLEKDYDGNDVDSKRTRGETDYTVLEAVKNRMFWILFFNYFFNGIFTTIVLSRYKTFGQQFISDDRYFAALGAVCAVFNCGSRIMWGRIYDMFTYRIAMTAMTILMTVTVGTFYFCSFIPVGITSRVVFFIWACLLFVGAGGTFTLIPSETTQSFGRKNMASIYGLLFMGLALASVVSSIVSSFLFNSMHYKGQFIMTAVSTACSVVLTQFFRPVS